MPFLGAIVASLDVPRRLRAKPPDTTAPAPPRPAFTPTPEMLAIQAASEKDHQRVMDELGIK